MRRNRAIFPEKGTVSKELLVFKVCQITSYLTVCALKVFKMWYCLDVEKIKHYVPTSGIIMDIKGKVSRDFFASDLPPSPWKWNYRIFRKFARYSQVKLHHRYQRTTGDKFATGTACVVIYSSNCKKLVVMHKFLNKRPVTQSQCHQRTILCADYRLKCIGIF